VERRAVKAAIALAAVSLLAAGAWAAASGRVALPWKRTVEPGVPTAGRIDARAPDSVRVKVEVLNASTVRGLARRATMHLRDRGFDVLYTGTSSERHDSTVVLDRAGHPEWAELAAKAMGGARVESRPDSSRYLHLTILVGASWRPPPEPLYP
jgi:hypothetical protein